MRTAAISVKGVCGLPRTAVNTSDLIGDRIVAVSCLPTQPRLWLLYDPVHGTHADLQLHSYGMPGQLMGVVQV
jgi:hypothetical protein